VLVQKGTDVIIAGAHRWKAAREAGLAEIPVVYLDVDDEGARRILLADNRINRPGSDDRAAMAALLQELASTPAELAGTGWDGDALDELLADLEHRDEITALQIIYNRPYSQRRLTYAEVKELAKSLEQPPHGWTAEALWRAYAQVERDRVRGAGAKRVFAAVFRFRFPRPLRCLPEYH
jgi:hypothetical protein